MYQGLPQAEAEKILKQYGPNEITDLHKTSALKILLRQLKNNYIFYLLVFSSVLSFVVGKPLTGYTVMVVILVIVSIGFIQEYRAEAAINSLRQMLMPVSFVIRNGKKIEVPSREIVPGDIVILGLGEKIPADCEILEEHNLRVNEATLTGESKDIGKTISATNGENLIFMGTYIVNGRCIAKVLHTGMNTRFGKIANMISTAEKDLPLQKKVNVISKYMVILAISVSVLTGLLVAFRSPEINYEVVSSIIVMVIALSISAFPEGLPVVLITTLATGVNRMAKRNAIVNRMSIIETLGETTVICTDKTGTITKGEMTVRFIFTGKALYTVSGSGYIATGGYTPDNKGIDPNTDQSLNLLLKTCVICNDSEIQRTGNDNEYKVIGTPTEGALLIVAAKCGIFKENIGFTREIETPFSSQRKMMSVSGKTDEGDIVYVKGAPEVVIPKCTNNFDTNKVLDLNSEMAKNSYRTMALAYKKISSHDEYTEDNLIFLGLTCMEDPPRDEVKGALEMASKAGIKVKMITGDHKETALAVAKEIGLKGGVMEGDEIDLLTDEELKIRLIDVAILTRVRPEHKLRIVNILRGAGEIVAMTGDGVNDAPALKEAHIGIAMGKNGTDVCRSVADLTLKDDNFATIIAAISEGRTVFNNIRKFVTYQLGCNFAELFVLFVSALVSPLFGWQLPLLVALQILFMNLVTDNLPAITLGFNPTSQDIMNELPRKNAGILNKSLIRLLVFSGIFMGILTLITFYVSFNTLGQSTEIARTTALVCLILLEIGNAYNFRSFRKTTLNRSPFTNRYLVGASVISIIATLVVVYTGANVVFNTSPINLSGWGICVGITLFMMIVLDVVKITNNRNKRFVADTR